MQACGRSFSTLLPFKVKNLTTNKEVKLFHTDNGKWNGDVNAADPSFPTAGIPNTHPGYQDCIWTPGEYVTFFADTVMVDGEQIVDKTYDLDFIYTHDFAKGWAYNLGICSNATLSGFSINEFSLSKVYEQGECVTSEGLVWVASTGVNPGDEYSIPNVWYGDNDINLNPWKPIYPWYHGLKVYMEPSNWFVDEDYWVADMSRLGAVEVITQSDLDNISVVPNPYVVSSIFNERENSNRIRFSRLPNKCNITIFTVAGEFVNEIKHENINNSSDGNAWWNLRNKKGRKVAPGLYIYVVETDNGLTKTGKFAIVR